MNDTDLDPFFDAARRRPDPAPDDLLARIEADALAEMPVAPPRTAPPSLWQGLKDAVGGWPALAGLATAALTGLWLGFAPPEAVENTWLALTGDSLLEFESVDGLDALMLEG